MRRDLVRLYNEATRLSEVYHTYKDSQDEFIRKKVHLDVDRFLMENRETALVLMEQGLKEVLAPPKKSKRRWFSAANWRV